MSRRDVPVERSDVIRARLAWPAWLVVAAFGATMAWSVAEGQARSVLKVLEDFQATNEAGFPEGWEAQRNMARAQESYRVTSSADGVFLAAKGATQRVFKRIAWDPLQFPIITWKWRLKSLPEGEPDPVAAVYVSLDTDLFVIPVATKYSWSLTRSVGTTTEGGFFGASEIVLRSGAEPLGEWVEERVNAYEDFKRLHDHEPAPEAWGISILAGPGVEIDFGPITAQAR